jgi:oligosaccharyltransferase complex subunit delta (ribophorin II)
VIVLFFTVAALATLPILLGAVSVAALPARVVDCLLMIQWLYLDGNLNHLSKALNDAPISHALFVGSIVGLEFTFFLYYTIWNLFQTLPVLGVLGLVAFLSGSRALTEVQDRRLAGLR